MWRLIAIIRLSAIAALLVIGVLITLLIGLLPKSFFNIIVRFWFQVVLWVIGVRCRYSGNPIGEVTLVVSNHTSWADVLVVGARWPMTFLAMQEVRSWPLVGWLAERVGTLFIERGRGAPQAIDEITALLKSGQHVLLFPEGRTGDGRSTGKFYPRIFQAAVNAGVGVQPVSIFYKDSNRPPGQSSRISMENIGFNRSAWSTLCGPPIDVEIMAFAPIDTAMSREMLASTARMMIQTHMDARTGKG